MDKVWIIENPYELPHNRKAERMRPEAPLPDEKNPAKAYSWSVLFWGGSQFYKNKIVKGLSFLSLMIAFYTGTVLTVLSWRGIVGFLRDHGMSVSVFLLVVLTLLLCGLIFRGLCCSNSYHWAAKTRKKRFTGTRSRVSPFLCSLLLPGWGQFLNGQPLKGSIFAGFAVVSCFSLVAVPVVLLAWKDLEPSSARFLVESVFTMAVLFLPLIPFVWMVGSFDALKISLDEWKKEPLWERLKAAYSLRRNQVWLRRVFRQIKRTLVLVLFLVFFLIVAYNYFPRGYYAGEVASARSWMQTQGMTLLPELLGKLLS
jgi:TM2 domain-containing membrane protein YozV